MSFSIQTNVTSLIAQQNLSVNSTFQNMTIQRLTSGYRINSSGDDAAGLAIANRYRSDTAELTQGVRNANDGISTLQIVDGGINNVSKMLDRLRTLATQSGSDTFTGDRSVLNDEFQSLLGEIDRQAQSIGLNSGGQFAESLQVFIGGGKDAITGGLNAANGTVSLDLRASAVDTQSLGLKGLQLVAGTTDIGTGSTSSVADLLADASNTTSLAGYSDLYFAGPGFSDGSKVKISVNLSGVTDVDTLANAINSAISGAGNGNTQAATAFKNANIVASVHTDASGGKELAFTSATKAFQVEAGDRLANAFLGELSGTTGNATTSTVTGATTTAGSFTPTGVTVRISGAGLTGPVDFTFDSGSTTTALAITDLTAQVNGSGTLAAAGITVSGSAGSSLVFTNARGEKFNVEVTGDTANQLGFGSFVAGASNAVDYSTIQGAAYVATTSFGSAHLEFSLNGAASDTNGIDVNLATGDATAATVTGSVANGDAHGQAVTVNIDGAGAATINIQAGSTTALAAAADINAASAGVTATVDSGGHIVITANAKGGHSVVIGGAGATTLGINGTITGNGRSGQSIADVLNSGFAADAELTAAGLNATFSGGKLTIASSNGTYFRLNAGTSAATADVGFGVAGAAYTGSTVSAAANTALDANGVSNTGALSFSPLAYGSDDQSIIISAADSTGTIQSKSILLRNDGTARTGRSIDEAITYINQQLQQSNNTTLQKVVAVKEDVGGTEKINFVSSLSAFSLSIGTAPNSTGFSGAGTTIDATTLGSGANVSIDSKAGALAAIDAIANAVTQLGTAQAAVGKGQNQLNYAVSLAQSQISNYSAAESRIRDADVAAEAANLTKAQVLQQASIAAMAQANSAPQAVLALLRG
jgi:flagellin